MTIDVYQLIYYCIMFKLLHLKAMHLNHFQRQKYKLNLCFNIQIQHLSIIFGHLVIWLLAKLKGLKMCAALDYFFLITFSSLVIPFTTMRIALPELKKIYHESLMEHSQKDPSTSVMSASFLRKENILGHYILKGNYHWSTFVLQLIFIHSSVVIAFPLSVHQYRWKIPG